MRNNLLLTLTIAGVFLGFILGFTIRSYNPATEAIMILSFPGDILMRMLKMLILPLITSSLITGMLSGHVHDGIYSHSISFIGLAVLDPKSSGKLGLYALTYYFCTTILAAILGIILVQVIRPGERNNKVVVRSYAPVSEGDQVTTLDAIFDLFRYDQFVR